MNIKSLIKNTRIKNSFFLNDVTSSKYSNIVLIKNKDKVTLKFSFSFINRRNNLFIDLNKGNEKKIQPLNYYSNKLFSFKIPDKNKMEKVVELLKNFSKIFLIFFKKLTIL